MGSSLTHSREFFHGVGTCIFSRGACSKFHGRLVTIFTGSPVYKTRVPGKDLHPTAKAVCGSFWSFARGQGKARLAGVEPRWEARLGHEQRAGEAGPVAPMQGQAEGWLRAVARGRRGPPSSPLGSHAVGHRVAVGWQQPGPESVGVSGVQLGNDEQGELAPPSSNGSGGRLGLAPPLTEGQANSLGCCPAGGQQVEDPLFWRLDVTPPLPLCPLPHSAAESLPRTGSSGCVRSPPSGGRGAHLLLSRPKRLHDRRCNGACISSVVRKQTTLHAPELPTKH